MKITADTYETYALDYLEGTLPPAAREAFEAFLRENEAVRMQIRALEAYLPVAEAETITYPDQRRLLRGRSVLLRRAVSLVGGGVAAAVLAGLVMLVGGPFRTKAPVADVPVAQVSAPRSIEAPVEQDIEASPDAPAPAALSQPAAPALRSASAARDSRLAQWNRKTARLLARLEGGRAPAPALAAAPVPAEPQATPVTRTWVSLAVDSIPDTRPIPMTTSLLAAYKSQSRPDPLAGPYRDDWRSLAAARPGDALLVRTLLGSIEKISPIKFYRTEESQGVEIVSILRIGSKNNPEK